LGAGLVTARALAHITERDHKLATRHEHAEHIVLIGVSDLSSIYMKALETFAPGRHRVVAVLDERPIAIGRSLNGIRVVGPPAQLHSLIEEFSVHGIRIDRVVVGGESDTLPDETLSEVRRVCIQRNLQLDFVPRLFGIGSRTAAAQALPVEYAAGQEVVTDVVMPGYFRFKRLIDFGATLTLVLLLLPLWLLVVLLVFLDVGSPVLFWQQRAGLNGRNFLLHKFRTLRVPFDWSGQKVPDEQRLSWIGQLLRKTRLDELPQLLNVLVGDMSLIGPRPLLPQDQPPSPIMRLAVRPGMTGWAQVNGGTLLSAKEKEELDEWYIRNASFGLDVRIVLMTLLTLARGDRRSESALAQAHALRDGSPNDGQLLFRQNAPFPPTVPAPSLLKQDDQSPAIRSW